MSSREVKKFLDWVRRIGWKVEEASKHYKLVPPSSRMSFVFCAKTPSCSRTIANTRALVEKNMRNPDRIRYKK